MSDELNEVRMIMAFYAITVGYVGQPEKSMAILDFRCPDFFVTLIIN